MPETKEITVYKFDELSDKAKERAMSDWAQHFDFDPACEIDYFKEQGAERGFEINDVRYSISYSQGDGAAWQGRVKLGPFIDYHLKDDKPDHARYIVLREIIRDGWMEEYVGIGYRGFHYCHSGTMQADDIDMSALWAEAEIRDGDEAVIGCDSVLKGASVRELANSIDYAQLLDSLNDWVCIEARSYADEIYAALLKEYEYQTSAEHFAEIAEANDWRFDEAGRLV